MAGDFRDGDVATFRPLSLAPGLALTRVNGAWPCPSRDCRAATHDDAQVLNDVQEGWITVRRDGRVVHVDGEPPRPEPHVFVRRQPNGLWSVVCAQPITCVEAGLIYTAVYGLPTHDLALRLADTHVHASTRLTEKSTR